MFLSYKPSVLILITYAYNSIVAQIVKKVNTFYGYFCAFTQKYVSITEVALLMILLVNYVLYKIVVVYYE